MTPTGKNTPRDVAIKKPDITSPRDLETVFGLDACNIKNIVARYPMKISAHFLSLIKHPHDPIWRQVVPDIRELKGNIESDDPLCEEQQSPVPNLVHRYPDRVLFLVSGKCAVYCRYCMRKRVAGQPRTGISDASIREGIAHIRHTPAVREVLLSGGDPLMLDPTALENILAQLKKIPHVEVVRIHTRVPGALPERITHELAEMLARFHPLFVNIQFNHSDELTPASEIACKRLADAGIPLGSQTVLLKGINDDPAILKALFTGLLKIRVKPYYLHHPDVVRGTGHFRLSTARGLKIVKSLHGHISGMAVPRYMIDLPGGGGKVQLVPESIQKTRGGVLRVSGFDGRIYEYPDGQP